MADSPSASISPSASASPSPAFDFPANEITIIEQSNNLTITEARPNEIIVVD